MRISEIRVLWLSLMMLLMQSPCSAGIPSVQQSSNASGVVAEFGSSADSLNPPGSRHYRQWTWRDSLFIDSPLFKARNRSYTAEPEFSFDGNGASGRINAYFDLSQEGRGTFTPLNKVFHAIKKAFSAKPQLDALPSVAQLHVFSTLWQRDSATSVQIYSQLPDSVAVSSEGLNRILEQMTQDNLLRRKLVSPRNEVFIGAAGIGVGIEMDPQNRRNRVYEYKSNLSRKEVQRFLSKRLAATADSANGAHVAGLHSLLRQLQN